MNAEKLEELAAGSEFEPIPVKTQLDCRIKEAEVRDTDAGGGRLAVSLVVESGEHKGRWVNAGFNIINANPEAERIALEELTTLSKAVGLDALVDAPSELEGRVVSCEVKRHREYNGKTYVDIGNWAPCGELESQAPTFTSDDDIPF